MMAVPMDHHAWRLADLLESIAEPGHWGERQVSALVDDSRGVIPGALFVARQGRHVHGLGFADEARRRGAVAILAEPSADWSRADMAHLAARLGLPVIHCADPEPSLSLVADRFHGAPSARLETFGITGELDGDSLAHALSQALTVELSCGLIGAIGHGLPHDLKTTDEAEPDALGLQARLDEVGARGAHAAAVEVSPRTLLSGGVEAVRFNQLVFTGLDEDRAGPTPDRAAVLEALIARARRPDLAWLILNLDDALAPRLLAALPADLAVAGYGLDADRTPPPRCDLNVRARRIEWLARGTRLEVVGRGASEHAEAEIEIALMGAAHARTSLAVLTLLLARGLSMERAARELGRIGGIPGRMEPFGGADAPLILVDAAATPAALERRLIELRPHQPRRILTVLGCRGTTDPETRARMGTVAERLSDVVILTDDDPGGVSGDAIIADILAGMRHPEDVRVARQRGLAIRIAIALAGRGDAVLIAGKGTRAIQDMGELKVRFSDRAQVVEALREWREGYH